MDVQQAVVNPITREVAIKIMDHGLGIRFGSDMNGAGYSLTELNDGMVFRAKKQGLTIAQAMLDTLRDHIKNSLLTMQKHIPTSNREGALILFKGSGAESNERYRFDPGMGFGDRRTLGKIPSVAALDVVDKYELKADTNLDEVVLWLAEKINAMQ